MTELRECERSLLTDQTSRRSRKNRAIAADPWAVDIQGIWEQAAHNPDPDKRKLF